MTDIPYLAVLPTVELMGPGDSVLANDMSFTLTHTLDPVMTSHAGQYTCRASVLVASVSIENRSTLIVEGVFIFSFYKFPPIGPFIFKSSYTKLPHLHCKIL